MNVGDRCIFMLIAGVMALEEHTDMCPSETCDVRDALMRNAAQCAINAVDSFGVDVRKVFHYAGQTDDLRHILAELVGDVSDALKSETIEAVASLTRIACLGVAEQVRQVDPRQDPLRN